jgi:hypothetical protein
MIDGTTLLANLLNSGAVQQQVFTPDSRYYALPIATATAPDGRELRYVTRRFIPPPEAFTLLQRYRVMQGDRVDVVAAAVLGEALLYWRLCDANLALDPGDLTAVPGAYLRVTLPAGVPGA